MTSDKRKNLEAAFNRIMNVGFCLVPYEDISDIVAPDPMVYGTAKDRRIFSFDGIQALFELQTEQIGDMAPQLNRERLATRLSADENNAVIIEEATFTLSSGDDVNSIFMRITCVMEYMDDQWKLTHWHNSSPVETENDPWHVKEWEAEKKRLEEKVNEQTADLSKKNRELEIEAATERVRAQAMGMQEPDDIMNVLNLIRHELDGFNLENIGTWTWIFNEDETLTQWDISETALDGNLNSVNITLDLNSSFAAKKHKSLWNRESYYTISWKGEDLQKLIGEINELDPQSGRMFEEAVSTGKIDTYWQACVPFSRGVLGLDYNVEPPNEAEQVLKKMASALDMAYRRFEDLQKAEEQAREAQIELSLERIRTQVTTMQESSDLFDIVVSMRNEFLSLGHSADYFWHMRWLPDSYEMSMTSEDGDRVGMVISIPRFVHKNIPGLHEWEASDEPTYVLALDGEGAWDYIEKMNTHGKYKLADPNAPSREDIEHIGGLTFIIARTTHGEIGYSLPGVVPDPPKDAVDTLVRFAGVFDLAYKRFEDLKKAEAQAYDSKVETSLERVRGMAAAMNHSDDLMQIAEAMFKEMEILKINPLRYGLGMIDSEKKEAELWASTVNDGNYLDMLGTLPLTWHPMLCKVFEVWESQHEELIYELKGEELSLYYQKVGAVNPHIPDLESLQDPQNTIIQYVSFFPFKTGALYAFTEGEPDEAGKSILKRFANVFEQAHIRYDDLQIQEQQARQIREERDRLADTIKELRATQEQLVQQEKLASLGQLTAGIAHEIKNPLNFVNNFSDVSLEMIEEMRCEIQQMTDDRGLEGEKAKGKSENETPSASRRMDGIADGNTRGVSDRANGEAIDPELLLDILDDIEANLKTIHKHGSRADSIVKSMLQHSRGGDGKMEPTPLNPLIKEYVSLAFHGMRAGKNPMNVDINLKLDDSIGEVPIIAEDFSRVILNLVNNAFDAMREKTKVKSEKSSIDLQGFQNLGGLDDYQPKLTVRTKSDGNSVIIEIKDNGPGIPDDMRDKIMQPFFTTKKGTAGTGLGLSITNDIIKAHGGTLDLSSGGHGSTFTIKI